MRDTGINPCREWFATTQAEVIAAQAGVVGRRCVIPTAGYIDCGPFPGGPRRLPPAGATTKGRSNMQVRDIMTAHMAFCVPEKMVDEVARMMVACDCGAIPVKNRPGDPKGRRDHHRPRHRVSCRRQGAGPRPCPRRRNHDDADHRDAGRFHRTVRCGNGGGPGWRMPVVDSNGRLCGIVAQADIARVAPPPETGHLLHDVSRPTDHASQVQ